MLLGGVSNPASFPPELLAEMHAVGNRPGHYEAFLSLLRNAASWEAATRIYRQVQVPVTLVWGDTDWANPAEREHHRTLLSAESVATLQRGGHFLPLDRPDAVIEHSNAALVSA